MHLIPPPSTPGDDDGNGSSGRRRGNARPRSGHFEDLPPLDPALDVEIPDDLSELDDEVVACRAELRRRHRRERVARFVPIRRGRHGQPAPLQSWLRGVPVVIGIVFLVAVGALGAMLPLVTPHPPPIGSPGAHPLATTSLRPGAVGGVMPDFPLVTARGNSRRASDLRPGLIVLLPPECDCARAIREIVGQAHERMPIPAYLIIPMGDDRRLNDLVHRPEAAAGRAVGLRDPNGALAQLFGAHPERPTLVLIAADGRLLREPRGFTVGDRLEGWLDALPTR